MIATRVDARSKCHLHTSNVLVRKRLRVKVPRQSESGLDERRCRVLKAAIDAFLRFGYAKTTLGDIAAGAKVHRPVLYSLFPGGKEDLFEASLTLWVNEIIDGYKVEVRMFDSTREKLLFCADHWCVEGFRLTSKHPDARDAFNIRYPAVRRMYQLLAAFYADLLRETVECSSLGVSAERFAELLVFSLRGVRQIPSDVKGMRTVVRDEIDILLAALHYRSPRAEE